MHRNFALITIRLTAYVLAIFTLCSCSNPDREILTGSIDPRAWSSGQETMLQVYNSDTVNFKKIDLFIRHVPDLNRKAGDIILQIRTITPDSHSFCESIKIVPSPTPDISRSKPIETVITYRDSALLRREGIYRFHISHNYPTALSGISAVGIEIKKHGER